MRLFITVNSPGELSGWAQPIVEEIKHRAAEVRVIVVVTPCQYASGAETTVARSLSGVDEVVTLHTLLKDLFIGQRRYRAVQGEKRCILFLGGDPFYAVLLGKCLHAPVLGYLLRPRWVKHYSHFFLSDEGRRQRALRAGVPSNKMTVVGYLGLDSVHITRDTETIRAALMIPSASRVVVLLPGSRPQYAELLLPFLLGAAEELSRRFTNCQFLLPLSPFIDANSLHGMLTRQGMNYPVQDGRIHINDTVTIRVTPSQQHESMAIADLAITIPGTNTLHLAALGIPMLMVLPFNRAGLLPLNGILGLLNPRIFPIGLIKRRFILWMNDRVRFLALPNMIADREIVPELRGILTPKGIADRAAELLEDNSGRARMSRELLDVTRERGAAVAIASALLDSLHR